MRILLLRLTGLALVLLIISACSDLAGEPQIVATLAPAPTIAPINVDNPDELGAAIYDARCSSCHGITGAGDGQVALNAGIKPPDFTIPETSADQTIEEWTQTIRVGRLENLMPPWENSLTPEEIDAVADYTYNLWQNPAFADNPDNPHAGVDGLAQEPDDTTEEITTMQGYIEGQITQGTADAELPETLFIGLHILDANQEQVNFHTQDITNTDSYIFDDITMQADYSYVVTVIHNDTIFTGESISGIPTGQGFDVPVTIYEITDDESVIQLDLLVTMIFQDGDQLIVQQFLGFGNTSDQAYREQNQVDTFAYESVKLQIPAQAQLLNEEALSSRFAIQPVGDYTALTDSKPVIPGSAHMVEVVYAMNATSANVEISIPINYDLAELPEIYLSPDLNGVNADGFSLQGIQEFNFGTFEHYLGGTLSAGEIINLEVQLPRTASSWQNGLVMIPLVLGIALVSLSGYMLITRPKPPTKDTILQQILELDDMLADGDLTQTEYDLQRRKLKEKLATLMEDAEI